MQYFFIHLIFLRVYDCWNRDNCLLDHNVKAVKALKTLSYLNTVIKSIWSISNQSNGKLDVTTHHYK